MKFNRLFTVLPFLVLLLLASCSEKELDPLDTRNFELKKYMNKYHKKNLSHDVYEKSGKPSVYIDLSDGLIFAYEKSENLSMIKYITQKLNGNEFDWYKLANGKEQAFEGDPYNIYNTVTNLSSYNEIMAPIKGTIEKIVEKKNDALFITDFEEYTKEGQEQFQSYAHDAFRKWILNGNRIDFFFLDRYTEKNNGKTTEKSLYFTVFSYGNDYKLLNNVIAALKGRGLNEKRFTLDLSSISATAKSKETSLVPWADGKGGIFFADNSKKESGYEYVSLRDWKNVGKQMESWMKNPKNDATFFNKLFVDVTKSDLFSIKDFDVKVYDVTEDYQNFCIGEIANTYSSKIKIVKNDKKEDVWDASSSKNTVISKAFKTNTKELKDEYKAIRKTDMKAIEKIFSLNTDIYKAHMKNAPKEVELRTEYNGSASDKVKLLRVDICVKNVGEKLDDLENYFRWKSIIKSGGNNICLSEAIRNVIQHKDVESLMNGKILYTYYIAVNQAYKLK